MFPRDYPTITAGRTLLNCSPAQFDQYLDPTRYVPRTGAIEELATQLGYTCTEQEGLHTIHNAEGVRVIDGVRSRRAAYREWWRKVGLQEATTRRAEQRAWEEFPRQGRRASSEDIERRHATHERSIAREAMYAKLEAVWAECRARLLQHSPQTEIWMRWALDRSLPRRHQINKIGERRALVLAVGELYDLPDRNPVLAKLLDGGEATDTEISEALQSEMAQMACDGELAGLLPRYALLIAVHLSPKPAIEVFHDLFNLLAQYEIRDREQLRTVCEVALW